MKPFDHRSGHTLACGSASVYYEVAGDDDRPALLLLHGGFGTIADFDGFLERLAGAYRVIGIDSRGQGRSTLGTQTLSYALLQSDVERVLRHLGVDDVGIVGLSDGGIVGYRLAVRSATTVRCLVAVSARWHLRQAERTRRTFVETTGASQRRDRPDTWDAYRALNPEPDFDRLAEALVGMWLDPTADGHPGDAIARIACPLLVVRGDDDALTTRQDTLDGCALVAGATWLNLPFAGHAVPHDQPDLFTTAVERFLDRRR